MATTTLGTGAAITEEDNNSDAGGFTAISDTSAITTGSLNAGTITALIQTTTTGITSLGVAILDVAMAVSAGDGKTFHLFRMDQNIGGSTNDDPVPVAGTYEHKHVGSFPIKSGTTRQYVSIGISIVKDQKFYIKNDTGQSTTGTTVVKVLPQSYNTK